ncbi:conserved hypothetical protein [Vibrio coralliirubri]|uniref:hypothetical protein n=1 Tax=Vibrio coralliirubri TaxID=1516159 RepID=UPI0006367329|nr:hypothetical protein [Vibrio coralliirubri]CDT93265.1 conserved hypothetical protein [Vibrio coralliirubri]
MIAYIGKWIEHSAVSTAFFKVLDSFDCCEIYTVSDNQKASSKALSKFDLKNYPSVFRAILAMLHRKEKKVIVPDIFSCILLSIVGFKCVFWVQGALPEESYLRHKSAFRLFVLNSFERLAFRLANQIVFVSPYMQAHYNGKYNLSCKQFVMPCLSELRYREEVAKIRHSFCYVGGVSEWQKIDWTIICFNRIRKVLPDAQLYIATGEPDVLTGIIDKYLDPINKNFVKVTSIKSREDMEGFLSKMEYGFLLRESNLVNFLSSPIKLAEYLSCGVNVIISSSVRSYAPIIESYNCGQVLERIEDLSVNKFDHNLEGSLLAYKELTSVN